MKQPHEHIAARYCQRTGSPFQADTTFRSKRFPAGAAVMACFLLAPFVWAGIYFAAAALFQW